MVDIKGDKMVKNIKRIITILLVGLFITNSGLLPIIYSVYAADGVSGDYIYEFDENDNATITSYTGKEKNLTIPTQLDGKNVIKIDEKAFQGNTYIENLNIPEGITYIGGQAFAGCINLASVSIPKSLEGCGDDPAFNLRGPFAYCEKLNNITFASGIENIPRNIFNSCTGITTITIPNTVTQIGTRAFNNCENLTQINWGTSLKEIGKEAFTRCEKLTSLNIPSNIIEIKESAFSSCTNIEDIKLNEGIQKIRRTGFL